MVSLEGSYGRLDRIANPRQGYVLAAPRRNHDAHTSIQRVSAARHGRDGVRAAFPKSGIHVPGGRRPDLPLWKQSDGWGVSRRSCRCFRLRDVTFTAGGTRDVRGWGSELVGPKLPQVKFESGSRRDGGHGGRPLYAGGRARATGGKRRIAAADPRVRRGLARVSVPRWGQDLDARQPLRPEFRRAGSGQDISAVGAGFGYTTVVGALQIAVGYKLNPSPLDLRSPQDVLEALSSGNPSIPCRPAAAGASISTSRSGRHSEPGCPGGPGAFTFAQSRWYSESESERSSWMITTISAARRRADRRSHPERRAHRPAAGSWSRHRLDTDRRLP